MTTNDPKYPDITVSLSGEDGNAITIVGRVSRALRSAGLSSEECAEFRIEALSGDYDNVLQTAMAWVSVS